MTRNFQKASSGINLNLLPPPGRSAALRKITAHFFTVIILFFIIWGAVILVFVAQGWIFLRIQNDALAGHLFVEQSTDTAQQTKAFEDAGKKTNALLSYAASIAQTPQYDDAALLALVSSLVPSGVHLGSLVINSATGTITIGGVADTRDEFLAFQQQLQNQPVYFQNVESPLSNLLTPNDVSFSFLVTLTGK